MQNINQLARKFVEGQWLYNPHDGTLKKFFASKKELTELNLIDANGFLDDKLKSAIISCLGEDVLSADVVGPFGDNDIFSGDIEDDDLFYNIELFNISELTLKSLEKIPGVFVSKEM